MKISLITVTYNAVNTLSRTIRSVLKQDYPDIEYIIVDGESADTTMTLVRDYAKKHNFIRYISEPDKGIYDAINKGINMATGDIIGLINADDALHSKDTISHIVKSFEQSGADILYGDLVYCQYTSIEHNPPRIKRYWKSNPFRPEDLRWGWMPPHPTIYCKREIFDRFGKYRTDFKISADYEFILRTFANPEIRTFYLDEILVDMEVGGISNRNLHSMLIKTGEDIRALRINGYTPYLTIIVKHLRKMRQFFRR